MAEDFMRQFGAETAEAMLFYDIEAMLTEQGRSYSDFGIPIPSKIYETLNEGQGVSVLTVAWTGIAPNLLAEGRAVHSRVKLTVPLLEMSTSSIRPNTKEADTIGKADVVIWDEAPMAQSYALKAVDILLRDIMNINVPFVLQRLPGIEKVYSSVDDIECDDDEDIRNYPTEFLNSLTPSDMLPHHICPT
ncbi:unnamed protein product [Rotaria socialis]